MWLMMWAYRCLVAGQAAFHCRVGLSRLVCVPAPTGVFEPIAYECVSIASFTVQRHLHDLLSAGMKQDPRTK